MEYGLLPTEAALSFIIILTLIYYRKQQYKNTKSYVFKAYLIETLLFSCITFMATVLIKYTGLNIFTKILWRLTYISLINAYGNFYIYGYVTIYDVTEMNVFKVMKTNAIVMATFIIMFLANIFFILPINIPFVDFITPDNIYFYSKILSIVLIFATLTFNLVYLSSYFKNKKKLTKDFIFANMIAITVALAFAIVQYFTVEFNWIPLSFTVIAYLLYFMIENPDIKLLAETKKLQSESNSEKSKTEFLANLNEEINIPINKMIEICNQMENEDVYDQNNAKKGLNDLTNECKGLLEKMNNVLDASQIKSNKTFIDNRRYEVKKLIRNVINTAQEKLEGKNIKLMINVNSNLSSKLYGDEEKLFNAISNVIAVSASSTRVGRLTILMSGTRNENTETITFKIVDTGEGIKEEEQNKVFDENSDEYHGITIAKKYLDMMGGKIWFESRYKMGTKFYIQYTQKIADVTPIGDLSDINKEVSVNMTQVDYSKYKILLVDDSVSNTKLTKRLLEEKKFIVEVITNGEECVRKVKAEESIDAIFMDIMMPEMDGVETLKVLKDLEGYTLPPIIALTANALSGVKESYLSEGFDDYISKPIDSKELDRVIKKIFNKQS